MEIQKLKIKNKTYILQKIEKIFKIIFYCPLLV